MYLSTLKWGLGFYLSGTEGQGYLIALPSEPTRLATAPLRSLCRQTKIINTHRHYCIVCKSVFLILVPKTIPSPHKRDIQFVSNNRISVL